MPNQAMTLRGKLVAMTIATIVALIVLFGVMLSNSRTELIEDRKEKVRNLVEAVHSQIAALDEQVKAGKLTLEAAQDMAKASLRATRYDEREYF